MSAKKVTREEKINYIKKNLGFFKPRSKADENKFNNYENAEDALLDTLYKVIQGTMRRKAQRESGVETTEKSGVSVKNKSKKNDIFKKYGLDKGADLQTLNTYLQNANNQLKDAQSLIDAINSRISARKQNEKAELEKEMQRIQKKLEKYA